MMTSLEVSKVSSQAKLKINPESVRKSNDLLKLGKEKLIDKNYSEATKVFTDALSVNSMNFEAMFYRGITYLDSGNPKKAITELSLIIENAPMFKNTVYLVLSISYMRVNDVFAALKILTKAIKKYPRFIEAYLARGQIYTMLSKSYETGFKEFKNDANNNLFRNLSVGQINERVITDFQTVINLIPNKGLGYVGKADALRSIGDFAGALDWYSKAIKLEEKHLRKLLVESAESSDTKKSLIMSRFKRSKLLYQLNMYDQALEDLNILAECDPENAHVHFYMGKIMSKKDPHTEAVIHLEQVIKHSNEPYLSWNALLEIAKLRIKESDFYEAHYNLKRIALFNFKSIKLDQYQTFTEGVLYLIKRKVKKGVQLLTSLLESSNSKDTSSVTTLKPKMREQTIVSTSTLHAEQTSKDNLDFFMKPLVYIYRAYGYIATESYEKAISDLITASKITKLDLWSQYNKLLAIGFSKLLKNWYEEAQGIFKKAAFGDFEKNKEPYLLQVISLISSVTYPDNNNDIINVDNPQKTKVVEEAVKILDSAIDKNKEDLTLYYYRGLALFYLHKFFDAFLDFDFIVEKEDEPMWKYYLARGRWYAWLSMFPEAVKDLTAAVTLDEDWLEAYLNRGKCAYLLGDTPLSFLDFQKLIMIEPKNPLVHVYAGNLLMTTGSYDDAAKAFSNADSVKKWALAIYQRARCNIALSEIDDAMKDLNNVMELNPHDKIAYTDKECLYAITQAIDIFKQNLGEEDQKREISKLTNILTRLTNKDFNTSNLNNKNTVTRTHAQIIPNVKRIKLEKLRIMNYLKKKEKDRYISEVKGEPLTIEREYTEKDEDLVEEAEAILPYSYYKENIFSEEDFYLYKAIMGFYSGEYDKAQKDFSLSLVKKDENKDDNDNSDTESETSNQTDLSDVGLCSLNIHESKYNQAVWFLILEKYAKALKIFDDLIDNGPTKYAKSLFLLRGLIYQRLNETSKSKLDFNKSFDEDHETAVKYFDKGQKISINPFPVSNRLCNHFPAIKCTIDKASPPIYLKPSFSFPFIKPPNMIPNVDEKVLSKEFSLGEFTLNRPEAPWIKRCEYGIKFTNEIQYDDFILNCKTPSLHQRSQHDMEESTVQEQSISKDPSKMGASVSEQMQKAFNFFDDESDSLI